MNDEMKEFLSKQNQVIATLVLRITTLETLLLEKHVITLDETVAKAKELTKEFAEKVQEGIRKAVETKRT